MASTIPLYRALVRAHVPEDEARAAVDALGLDERDTALLRLDARMGALEARMGETTAAIERLRTETTAVIERLRTETSGVRERLAGAQVWLRLIAGGLVLLGLPLAWLALRTAARIGTLPL
jgi:hypothetical protein